MARRPDCRGVLPAAVAMRVAPPPTAAFARANDEDGLSTQSATNGRHTDKRLRALRRGLRDVFLEPSSSLGVWPIRFDLWHARLVG